MPFYFDSSVILCSLLQQPGADAVVGIWESQSERVSSILLEAECVTVLRRAASLQPARNARRFLSLRLDALDELLKGIHLRNVDAEVLRCLHQEPRFGGCRTLDAIHLATAMLFQEQCEDPVTVATMDERMKLLSVSLGFPVS